MKILLWSLPIFTLVLSARYAQEYRQQVYQNRNRYDNQVIGTTGGVFFADVTNVISYPSTNTDYENVVVHYLTKDDSIDLTTGKRASDDPDCQRSYRNFYDEI